MSPKLPPTQDEDEDDSERPLSPTIDSTRKDNPNRAASTHRRVRLTVAYDGAAFLGWQIQPQSPTAQEVLEGALAKIFPSAPRVVGSSRTDTGVHARGLVVHLDVSRLEWRMTPRKLILALNAHLPDELRIMAASLARPEFHARFDACRKQYRYQLWNHVALDPLLRGVAWHIPRPLNIAAMKQAARNLLGRHDFRSFAANPGYERATYIRNVTRCDVRRSGALITVILEADGFLYKMCRGIVGTLVQVGQGKFLPNDVLSMLELGDRRVAGMTAPAHGLILWKVHYGVGTKKDRPK